MTLEEFKKLCDAHDWAYEYSDDYDLWLKESQKHFHLIMLAIDGGIEFKKEFNRRNEAQWKS